MAHSKLYIQIMNSSQWRKLRDTKRAADPLCEECLKHGIMEPMREVHHIKEIESGRSEAECKELAFAWNNLQSLCHSCHKAIHCGSHTKAAHKKRQADRLAQWISENT
ncbi:MAG: HNH endonuclease [Prevotellaceae bacterium]|nr:HNH endonuclease [Prevotellaceae bacterium]